MRDWENLIALGIAAAVVVAIVIFKPDGPALALSGSVVGACLTWLQRRPVQ